LVLLGAVYVVQSTVVAAEEARRGPVVDASKKANIEKRSTDDEDNKRDFRPDLGKRDDDDDDDGLRQSPHLLTDRQQRSRNRFRGDLGKRRSSFRGDLGKRRFRGDLGKRIVDDGRDAGPLTPVRSSPSFRRGNDVDKRRSFRGDLGKRYAAPEDGSLYDSWSDGSDDDDEIGMGFNEDAMRNDFSNRRSAFRGDPWKRRASFRGDLGK